MDVWLLRKVFVCGCRRSYGGWHSRIESLQVLSTLDFGLGLGLGFSRLDGIARPVYKHTDIHQYLFHNGHWKIDNDNIYINNAGAGRFYAEGYIKSSPTGELCPEDITQWFEFYGDYNSNFQVKGCPCNTGNMVHYTFPYPCEKEIQRLPNTITTFRC